MKRHKLSVLLLLILILSLLLTACGKTKEAKAVDSLILSIGEFEDISEENIEEIEKAVSDAEAAYRGDSMYAKQYVDAANTLNQGMNLMISSVNTGSSDTLKKGAEKIKEAVSLFIEFDEILLNSADDKINHILGKPLESSN